MDPARLTRAPDVVEEDLDGELLLLRVGSTDAVHLNRIAAQTWRLLEQPLTEQEVATAVADSYALDVAQVAADLRPVLHALRRLGLVVQS